MREEYNPKVLGICCRWCSYAGTDLASAICLQYPPAVKIMLVPCTGRVDILHLLKAFEAGWDSSDLSWQKALTALQDLVQFANRLRLRLCVENLVGGWRSRPWLHEKLLRLSGAWATCGRRRRCGKPGQ